MTCKCRTKVFTCDNSKSLVEALKTLNKKAWYYFVIYEEKEKTVYLERASLIDGNTKDIKAEKDSLICELIKLKDIV